jgi:hypothetical protein
LTKRQVESLLGTYDDDPIRALSSALRHVLGRPDAPWPELVAAGGFSDTRAAALLVGDQTALDQLVAELNELRNLDRA